jgi:putative membrane protein
MPALPRILLIGLTTSAGLWIAHELITRIDLPGAFSHHMIWHILLMNLAAPLTSIALCRHWRPGPPRRPGTTLLVASALQLALLFFWHAPPTMELVMASPKLAWLMQFSLFSAALWFWLAISQQAQTHVWRPLAALIVTGKLYCLMAVLLVFAPRTLYPGATQAGAISLADQQLAGVMMAVACPLSYVVAATVLTARWLTALRYRHAHATTCTGLR